MEIRSTHDRLCGGERWTETNVVRDNCDAYGLSGHKHLESAYGIQGKSYGKYVLLGGRASDDFGLNASFWSTSMMPFMNLKNMNIRTINMSKRPFMTTAV